MPFNQRSYYRNKARNSALRELAEARDIKKRAAAGEAYDWEIPRIATRVKLARLHWRTYLGYVRGDRMNEDIKRIGAGEMTHAEFQAKWEE